MMAKRKAGRWTGVPAAGRIRRMPPGEKRPAHTASDQIPGKRTRWRDRESRLVEALLEVTTIAGLFALLFALFVLFGAAQTLAP
ncbi:hypothetical protein TSH100_20575 [Azospirillum sp. TSH100]|uniref:hypothetical protein n=1 Tax=Azospirillum sp. TSH100 TaxID=652764 RepID=UPI000D606F84|nr:hypothetical protein [Azospirillum sp. TSH100]PWC83413.1 hypothetical protein TSH100_20575 [Azospirillum sp. TSH100]QCG87327.1 hypothetical protein E6C72_06055 [Azospirillum sp. TSH100]